MAEGKTIVLFDVDGTLTVPGQLIEPEMLETLAALRAKGYTTGIVGAADFEKIQKQLGGDVHDKVDMVFAESGVHAFRGGKLIHQMSIQDALGPERWAAFETGLETMLLAEKDAREKVLEKVRPGAVLAERETFLEKRPCTINVTPIGRNPGLTKDERYTCDKEDKQDGLRVRIVDAIHKDFGPETEYKLAANIGGQIGIDLGIVGWDKTFCLQFLDEKEFPTLHFFGDKTDPGGGDHELYEHPRSIGHSIVDWQNTMSECKSLFL